MSKDTAFKTMIGGQALIEGILMRGPFKQSIVVRSKDGLVTKVEDLELIKDKHPILGYPIIRGCVNFFDSMVSGVKALMYSAEYFPEEEDMQPSKFDLWIEEKLGSKKAEKIIVYLAVVLGILFSVGLFFLLPTLLTSFLVPLIGSGALRNIVEGLVRILIFLIYMIVISRMKDMRRVFSYHGAEHKTIRCYEAGLPLTVENVREQTRLHPRCGTSFMFVVIFIYMIISVTVFSLIQASNPLLRVLLRLLMIPLVVSISYELNRYVGRNDNALTRILTKPGLWFQNFTTFEPEDGMIEVGIEAMKLVIPDEKGADEW